MSLEPFFTGHGAEITLDAALTIHDVNVGARLVGLNVATLEKLQSLVSDDALPAVITRRLDSQGRTGEQVLCVYIKGAISVLPLPN